MTVASPINLNTADRVNLEVSWPWWIHPAGVLLLMVGTTAWLSIAIPTNVFAVWNAPKFLDGELSAVLAVSIMLTFFAMFIASHRSMAGGHIVMTFRSEQLAFLKKAYRVLFILTVIGYLVWAGSAASQGVRFTDLAAVLERESGAISGLKADSRPIGGVTTLTQFGPVVVVLGYLLRRLTGASRGYLVIVALAAVRTVFYAERLALIEVLIPLALTICLTVPKDTKRRRMVQAAPVVLAPIVWTIFAISEYARSWIFYQQVVNIPFLEWVTLRLLGYYTTAYNNSALFFLAYDRSQTPPYNSFSGFWNAPGISTFLPHPGINGNSAEYWWTQTLISNTNPEFTNTGSFLVTYAELGWLAMSIFWVVIGGLLGRVFAEMKNGSLPAMIAYSVFFIGILELPRFIYWTQGRAFPMFVAVIAIALLYPKEKNGLNRRRFRGLSGSWRHQISG